MTAIICSMYCEAKAIIEYYSLKKISVSFRFQIFINSDIILAVCGIGNMNSAICASYIITEYKVDLLVNIGICGASNYEMKIGDIYICNKVSSDNGKTFYPDILYKHEFFEAEIFSLFEPYVRSAEQKKCLYDMESLGIMEVAYVFLSPNQSVIIKIVSDYGDTTYVTPDMIYKLTSDNFGKIAGFIKMISDFNSSSQLKILTEYDTQIINDLCKHFRFTVTMEFEILRYAKLYKLKNESSLNFLEKYMLVGTKTKKEGKAVFNDIKRELSK